MLIVDCWTHLITITGSNSDVHVRKGAYLYSHRRVPMTLQMCDRFETSNEGKIDKHHENMLD